MGRQIEIGKVKLDSHHIKKLQNFVNKLYRLENSERLIYMNSIKVDEIRLISELVYNFLNFNIIHDRKSLILLERVKNYMYMLASKKVSFCYKKKILSSLKGIHIINILLPLVIKTFRTK